LGVILIGDFFTIIFLIGVPEKSNAKSEQEDETTNKGTVWHLWFRVQMFYQVGIVYTLTRVAINLSQIFMPFLLRLGLNMGLEAKQSLLSLL